MGGPLPSAWEGTVPSAPLPEGAGANGREALSEGVAKAAGPLAGKQERTHDGGTSTPGSETPGVQVPSVTEHKRRGFQPGPVGPSDIESARSKRDRIWELADAKVSESQITTITKLKVGAIHQVLGEPRPVTATKTVGPPVQPVGPPATVPASGEPRSTGWSPGGGFSAAPSLDSGTGMPPGEPLTPGFGFEGNFQVPSLYTNLFSICREAGLSEAYSKGIVRGFARRDPKDFAYLDSLLAISGAPAAARRLVVENYKGEASDPNFPEDAGPSTANDPVTAYRRRMRAERLERIQDLDLARLERESRVDYGGQGSHDSRIEQLVAQNRELTARLEKLDRKTELENALSPLYDKLKEIEARTPGRKTQEDVKAEIQSAAGSALVRTLDDKLKQVEPGALARAIKTNPKFVSKGLDLLDSLLPTMPGASNMVEQVPSVTDLTDASTILQGNAAALLGGNDQRPTTDASRARMMPYTDVRGGQNVDIR